MHRNIFGRIPYQACFYGAPDEKIESLEGDIEEIELLCSLLDDFKKGDFLSAQELTKLVDFSEKNVK